MNQLPWLSLPPGLVNVGHHWPPGLFNAIHPLGARWDFLQLLLGTHVNHIPLVRAQLIPTLLISHFLKEFAIAQVY